MENHLNEETNRNLIKEDNNNNDFNSEQKENIQGSIKNL